VRAPRERRTPHVMADVPGDPGQPRPGVLDAGRKNRGKLLASAQHCLLERILRVDPAPVHFSQADGEEPVPMAEPQGPERLLVPSGNAGEQRAVLIIVGDRHWIAFPDSFLNRGVEYTVTALESRAVHEERHDSSAWLTGRGVARFR